MLEVLTSIVASGNVVLIFLFVVLAFSFGYTFAIVYHLVRFGIGTGPKKAAVIYFIGAVLLMFTIFGAYLAVDTDSLTNGIRREIKQNNLTPYRL